MSNTLGQALKKMKYPYKVFTQTAINTNLKALQPHFNYLNNDLYLQRSLKLPDNQIMRQRRMMGYNIEFDIQGNITQFHEDYKTDEYDDAQPLANYARLYDEFTQEMKQDQNFKDYLYNTLQICWELKQMKKATITCHAIRTISYQGQPANPTPEGPHQDGVDLEVIAVVGKENCQGAESQIFSPDKKNLLFEMTLDPGEGYFIDGLNLWHYATIHNPIDNQKLGTRDILGYLLKIHEFHQVQKQE